MNISRGFYKFSITRGGGEVELAVSAQQRDTAREITGRIAGAPGMGNNPLPGTGGAAMNFSGPFSGQRYPGISTNLVH